MASLTLYATINGLGSWGLGEMARGFVKYPIVLKGGKITENDPVLSRYPWSQRGVKSFFENVFWKEGWRYKNGSSWCLSISVWVWPVYACHLMSETILAVVHDGVRTNQVVVDELYSESQALHDGWWRWRLPYFGTATPSVQATATAQ